MDGFNEEVLVEKLSKLNNTQTSIETLSHWCCFHRAKRSKQVVQIWGQEFARASTAQKVTLLYLANDILQNSRKKGPEFVNEFWTVLPPLLSDKKSLGDPTLQQSVGRLAKIWEERKVFGSKGAAFLQIVSPTRAAATSPSLTKSSSIRSIAGPAYAALISCLKAVHDASEEEKQALEESRAAAGRTRELQQAAEAAAATGGAPATALLSDLRTHQTALARSTERLRAFENKRTNAITLLSEALRKQEMERTVLRDEMKAASGCAQQTEQLRAHFEGSTAEAPEPSGREGHPTGAPEAEPYSPTQPGLPGDLPPGYAPPAQYAPAPDHLTSDSTSHQHIPPIPYQPSEGPPHQIFPTPSYHGSEHPPHQSFPGLDPRISDFPQIHPPGPHEAPPGGPEFSAADLAASLASVENPADLLQAFSALSQENLAALGNFSAFQDGAKRQKLEELPQQGQQYAAYGGGQMGGEFGGGEFQAPPPPWYQPQEVQDHRAQHVQHFQHPQ